MLVIYAAKGCEKIAVAVAQGASAVETKTTQNAAELTGEKNVVCLAKKPLGGEVKNLQEYVADKTIYIIGAGYSFENMRKTTGELEKKGAKVENTLCLKRSSALPFGAEVGETELARAKAFGERIATSITGVRNLQENEKNRIKNYQQGVHPPARPFNPRQPDTHLEPHPQQR